MAQTDLLELCERVVRRARRLGATQAEAFGERTREATVRVREGEVEDLTRAEGKGIGLRVFKEGRLGFAFTSDFSDDMSERKENFRAMGAALIDRFLELPLEVQLGVIRTVAPRALVELTPEERAGYLRDLDDEIAELARSEEPFQAGTLQIASVDPEPKLSIDLNAYDRESSVNTIEIAINGEWSDPLPYQGRIVWPLPAVEGAHEVAVRFWDRAEHSTTLTQTVLLNLAPRATISLRDNDQINATLEIKVEDASEQIEMQLSADPHFSAAQWQPFRSELQWAWGPVREHVLYARFRDAEGLVSPTLRVSDQVWTLYLPQVVR